MNIVTKKCGWCDTWQPHIEGHDECMYCEGYNQDMINELEKVKNEGRRNPNK